MLSNKNTARAGKTSTFFFFLLLFVWESFLSVFNLFIENKMKHCEEKNRTHKRKIEVDISQKNNNNQRQH